LQLSVKIIIIDVYSVTWYIKNYKFLEYNYSYASHKRCLIKVQELPGCLMDNIVRPNYAKVNGLECILC